jgi:hypothetical protein
MAETANQYRIWSNSMSAEGPFELPALVAAIKCKRVQAGTWLYLDHEHTWVQAARVPELKMFFDSSPFGRPRDFPPHPLQDGAAAPQIKLGPLRRMRLFADFDEQQLEVFVRLLEVQEFKQFATVVTAGDNSDAMYLVLEGELRARNLVDGREMTLATMGVGEAFGELSLLDHGPRSADVIANQPSVLLKISSSAIERLLREAPALVAPFLHALSRSIAGRVRGLTKKYQDSIHFSRVAGTSKE